VRSTAVGAAAGLAGAAVAGAHANAGPAIIEGVEPLGYGKTACECFAGSLAVAMRHRGEDVTDDYAMGITGAAFKTIWGMPWWEANCAILVLGGEPIRRAFTALGYEYTNVTGYDRQNPGNGPQSFRDAVVASIDQGRPAIARGPVGPPEASVVTGCDRNGEVIYGWSYFQEDPSAHFRAEDWTDACAGLIVIGEKQTEPFHREVLTGVLEWAIKLTRVPEIAPDPVIDPGPRQPMLCGLAAYDAFAEGLERDADFPADDLPVLLSRLIPVANDGVYHLRCTRGAASRFLNVVAEWEPTVMEPLLQAAAAYQEEAGVWAAAAPKLAWDQPPEEQGRRIADPGLRRELAESVRQAKAVAERAVTHLETAYGDLTGEGA